jgi:hypothetical protein
MPRLQQKWHKRPAGTRQTDGKNLVWFGEIERKLAKLSMTTFAYRSSSYLFYECNILRQLCHDVSFGTE